LQAACPALVRATFRRGAGTTFALQSRGEADMDDKKLFRCPRCQHTEEERVPHRARCPRCGYGIVRPERDDRVVQTRRRLSQISF